MFYFAHGHYHTVTKGNNHGYVYSIHTHRFHLLRTPGDTGSTAAGINNQGDVAGFATNGGGNTEAFLKLGNGKMIHLNYPGASATQAFGLNNGDEVVGFYTDGAGNTDGMLATPVTP